MVGQDEAEKDVLGFRAHILSTTVTTPDGSLCSMAAVFTMRTQHNGERYMNAFVYSFGSYHTSDQVDQLFADMDTASVPLKQDFAVLFLITSLFFSSIKVGSKFRRMLCQFFSYL